MAQNGGKTIYTMLFYTSLALKWVHNQLHKFARLDFIDENV